MKKSIVSVITAAFLVGSFFLTSGAAANPAQALPQGSVTLQKASSDITGDGQKDKITLAGQKFDSTSPYYKSFFIQVNNTLIKLPKDYDGGMDPKFILRDFNGDKLPDIYLSTATGGSGGIMNYFIYSLKGGKPNLIFSPTPDSAIIIKGSFVDNYKVKLSVQQTGKTYTIDFSDRKSTYNDLYKNGKLQKKVDVETDYYGLLTPVDTDKDGVYELQGVQAVWGVAHVDTLVQVKSTWKWVNNKWKVLKADIVKMGDSPRNITSDQDTLLKNMMALAKNGKIINCEFPVNTTCEDDIEKKWGKPDKMEWIAAAKGTYATFSKHNAVFGFNKGMQIFEARSFDKQLGQIKLSNVREMFGKPAHDVKTGGQEILGYVASKDYKILIAFSQPTKQIVDPIIDHYSVFYPSGTVNMMADDPGRQW